MYLFLFFAIFSFLFPFFLFNGYLVIVDYRTCHQVEEEEGGEAEP